MSLLLYNVSVMATLDTKTGEVFGGTKKMSGMAFAGAMITAFIVDLIGILVPIIGTIYIAFMRLSFWLVGYDMRKTGLQTVVNGALEGLPIIPCCLVFVASSYHQNKKNVKEREEKAKKEGSLPGKMRA